jgi:hypothetical protein
MFQNTVDQCLAKLKPYQHEPIPTVPIQMATNICNFLEALITKDVFKQSENIDETKRRLGYIFAFSFIWGIGGSLDSSSHDRVSSFRKI